MTINSSFLTEHPFVQFGWDATSLSVFKECPRKYYYVLICGWRPKGENIHFTFGSHYHKVLELYDHAIAAGTSHDEAVLDAVKFCLLVTAFYDVRTGEMDPNQEEVIEQMNGWELSQLQAGFPYNFSHFWQSHMKEKNRFSLTRAVVWYLEQFKNDPAKTVILANGKAAVELSFRMELPITSVIGDPFLYSGHLDRLVEYQKQSWILDRKTTKSQLNEKFFAKFDLDTQMTGYTAASKVVLDKPAAGVIIDGVQLAVTFARYSRGLTLRTDAQLDEFLDGTMSYIRSAEKMGLAAEEIGMAAFPMNESSCHMYAGCQFCGICSKDPSIRETYLKTDFRKEIWDPLQSR